MRPIACANLTQRQHVSNTHHLYYDCSHADERVTLTYFLLPTPYGIVNYHSLKRVASRFNVSPNGNAPPALRSGGSRPTVKLSKSQNVLRGVGIAVHPLTAFRTKPFALGERQVLVDGATGRVPLGRGEEAVNLTEMAAVPCALVGQLAHELAPSGVADGFGETVIA